MFGKVEVYHLNAEKKMFRFTKNKHYKLQRNLATSSMY